MFKTTPSYDRLSLRPGVRPAGATDPSNKGAAQNLYNTEGLTEVIISYKLYRISMLT